MARAYEEAEGEDNGGLVSTNEDRATLRLLAAKG